MEYKRTGRKIKIGNYVVCRHVSIFTIVERSPQGGERVKDRFLIDERVRTQRSSLGKLVNLYSYVSNLVRRVYSIVGFPLETGSSLSPTTFSENIIRQERDDLSLWTLTH